MFLLTYIAVLCLPVLTWLVANRSYHNALTERERETNSAQLGQAQMVIDQQFLTINQLAQQASNSLVIQRALRVTPPVRSSENIAYKDAVDTIFNMNVAYTGIDHLYIYMRNTDEILYHSGKYSKEVFYSAYHGSANFSYEDWEGMMRGEGTNRLVSCTVGERKKILFLNDITPPGGGNALGRLVIQLDTARVEQMLPKARGGYSALLDQWGTPLYQWGDASIWEAIRAQASITGAGYEIKAGGESILIETRASELSYLGYISATPASLLQREVNGLLYSILGILAASVAMAFVTSVLFARRMAGPLARAASALELPGGGGGGALNRLSEAALEMVSSNREILRRLEAQRPMAKNNLLLRLMQGETRITEVSMQDSFGIEFAHDYFLCIRAEAVDDQKEDSAGAGRHTDILLANALLQRELEEFGAIESVIHSYNIVLLLINRADGNAAEDALAEACDRARRQTVAAGGYTLRIALGTWQKGVEGISASYFDAVDAERSRFAAGSDAVCVYTGQSVRTAYFFPGTWKKRLATTIMAGDAAQASAIIEALIARNSEKATSAAAMKSLHLDICSTLLSGFLDDAEGPGQEEIMALMNGVITGAVQADEAVSRIWGVIRAVCQARQESRRTSRDALRDRMLRCVDARYMDPNITVGALAEEIGLNPSYLSHSFRELVGDTIMDTIHKKRVERAKELMRREELTLHAIAEQVGYVNDTVFIRHFKKIEGITPGRYRQLNLDA